MGYQARSQEEFCNLRGEEIIGATTRVKLSAIQLFMGEIDRTWVGVGSTCFCGVSYLSHGGE